MTMVSNSVVSAVTAEAPAIVPKLWRIALDFDGTIVEKDLPLRFRRGALEFINAAPLHGVILVLNTCRASWQPFLIDVDAPARFFQSGMVPPEVEESWRLYDEMRTFLSAHGIWSFFEVWSGPGKPRCDQYVDDRASPPDFIALAAGLGVVFSGHGSLGHPTLGSVTTVGGPAPTPIRIGASGP